MKPLKTAEQAVLTAVGALGHGNVHQLAEASGYARSTVDKALKALSGAGLIAEYDTGADPAEGTPTQWQLSDDDASTPIGAHANDSTADEDTDSSDLGDDHDEDSHVEADEDDTEDDNVDDHDVDVDDDREDDDDADNGGPSRKPSNQRVLMIAGAMVAFPDGATAAELHKSTNIPANALDRLLSAMVSGAAAVLIDGVPRRWRNGTADPAGIDPFPPTPRCGDCQRTLPAGWTAPAASTADEARTAPDAKVLMLAGSMFPYGEGGATTAQLAADSRLTPEMVARLLAAMETAGVAARVDTVGDGEQPGEPLWVLKPGPLNTVDPEPKCTGCGRPQPGVRSSRKTPTGVRRADALPRNTLFDATLAYILARPGVNLSPGRIAADLTVELERDEVSPGAIKNNCVKLAARGNITEVSSKPWLFGYFPATDGDTANSGDTEANGGDAEATDSDSEQASAA